VDEGALGLGQYTAGRNRRTSPSRRLQGLLDAAALRRSNPRARVLGIFGDSLTTDHISPAGSIKPTSPAGIYLQEHDVPVSEFNSFGARRGNHEVMLRGTFGNVRIKNLMLR